MKKNFTKNWVYALLICLLAFASNENLKAQPVVSAGLNQTVLCGSDTKTVTLTGSPIGGTWTSNSNNNATAVLGTTQTDGTVVVTLPVTPFTGTLIYTYTYTGVYVIPFSTTHSDVSVFVNGPASPVIDLHTGKLPFACDNKTVQLCPKIFGYSKYQWYKNGSAISGVGESSCITLDVTGIGSYTLAGNDGSGCWSQPSAIYPVTTFGTATPPTISYLNGTLSLCNPNSSVDLQSSILTGIEWYKNGVATGLTAVTINVDQAKVGDYTVLHTDASL